MFLIVISTLTLQKSYTKRFEYKAISLLRNCDFISEWRFPYTGQVMDFSPDYSCEIFLRIEISNPEIWKSDSVPEFRLLVLDYVSVSMGIFVKALPHLRCAAFTNISHRNYDLVCTKENIKSDFHLQQLMGESPRHFHFGRGPKKECRLIPLFFG